MANFFERIKQIFDVPILVDAWGVFLDPKAKSYQGQRGIQNNEEDGEIYRKHTTENKHSVPLFT